MRYIHSVVIALLAVGVLSVGCGFMGVEAVKDDEIPEPWPVSIENSYYVSSVTFTGDPDADFGDSLTKTDTSDVDVVYNDGSPYRNISKVYIGYNPQGLYLGLYTSTLGTGQNDMGRALFLIDNGITNQSFSTGWNGITNGSKDVTGFTAEADKSLALDGSEGNYGWDTIGTAVTSNARAAGRKVSCWVQHWRPLGDNFAFYSAAASPVDTTKTAGTSLIRIPSSGTSATNVTEVFLTWAQIFGTSDTNAMPEAIYLAIQVDSGIATSPTGVDVYPNDGGDEDPKILSSDMEWRKVLIK